MNERALNNNLETTTRLISAYVSLAKSDWSTVWHGHCLQARRYSIAHDMSVMITINLHDRKKSRKS